MAGLDALSEVSYAFPKVPFVFLHFSSTVIFVLLLLLFCTLHSKVLILLYLSFFSLYSFQPALVYFNFEVFFYKNKISSKAHGLFLLYPVR